MTVISQSILMNPVNGGTVTSATGKFNSACVMSNTRMIVCYMQTTPTLRNFSIIDNPNGINDAGAPTISNNIYRDSVDMSTAGSVKMLRLNATTFMVAYNANNGTAWTVHVFNVTGTTIAQKYTTTYTFGGSSYGYDNPLAFGPAQQSIAFIPLGDNTVLVNDSGYYTYTSGFGGSVNRQLLNIQLYWNGTALSTIDNSGTFPFGNGNSLLGVNNDANWQTWDVYYTTVPGSTTVLQVIRGVKSTTAKTDATGYSNTYYRSIRQTGAAGAAWTYDALKTMPNNYDVATSSISTQVWSDWGATYYGALSESINATSYYQSSNAVRPSQGGGVYAAASNAGDITVSTPFVLPIDANYHAVIDRRHFVTPGSANFQMKIVRRADSQIVESSTGSTGQYGFKVTVPAISVFWDKPRPWVQSGDIMWFGMSGQRFCYNIIKQPALPSN